MKELPEDQLAILRDIERKFDAILSKIESLRPLRTPSITANEDGGITIDFGRAKDK